MFSPMWSTREVAGIAQVTAGCETMNLRKSCAQFAQSISAAHSGSGCCANRSNSCFAGTAG